MRIPCLSHRTSKVTRIYGILYSCLKIHFFTANISTCLRSTVLLQRVRETRNLKLDAKRTEFHVLVLL